MKLEHDLLGEPIVTPPVARKGTGVRKIGYPARTGSGPKGKRCGNCRHAHRVVHAGITSHKCELMNHVWDYTERTDIHLQAPACRHWLTKPYSREKD